MKRLFIPIIVAAFALVFVAPSVQAQAEAPIVVKATKPIDAEIRSAVEAWLGSEHAPVYSPYWAITYHKTDNNKAETLVSIAALDIEDPSEQWQITEDAFWLGTVKVNHYDLSVEMHSKPETVDQAGGLFKLSAPALPAAGGGSYISFPWYAGASMMYGPRGVHAAGGGSYSDGFVAVDLVGGDNMGSGVAPPQVFAALGGVVDYICESTTVVVRTYNSTTNDYLIYAHMLPNAGLEMDAAFSQGQMMGTLKYGNFIDDCGWAEQAPLHYHLHFGFQPANNAMRIENCILNISNQVWQCGTRPVSTGQFLVGGGGAHSGGDSGGGMIRQPGFFDYILSGAISIFDRLVIRNLPEHANLQMLQILYVSAKLAIRVAFVLVHANINLKYLIVCIMIGVIIRVNMAAAELTVMVFKTWNTILPKL